MQLRLQRSQRAAGLTASTILFCLDVRADYSAEERSNINRYKLGGQVIYSSRAAQRHSEAAGAHLSRTQEGTTGHRLIGLARGAASMALAKMHLNISIATLGRGHHVECKDLEELLESEDTIRTACKNLTRYLEVANTFDGSEVVVEYVNGEEKVHIAQGATPLLQHLPSDTVTKIQDGEFKSVGRASYSEQFSKILRRFRGALGDLNAKTFDTQQLGKLLREIWDRLGQSGDAVRYMYVGGAIVILFLLLRACV